MNKKILSLILVLTMMFSIAVPVTATDEFTEPTEISDVIYDANGGTGAPTKQAKVHNVGLTLSKTKPTRAGYDFVGWSTKKTGTSPEYQPGGLYKVNRKITLYAIWKIKPMPIPTVKPISPPRPTPTPCIPIKLGQKINVGSVNKTMFKYYSFKPTVSGKYVITSTGSTGAANLALFNSSWKSLGLSLSYTGNNFKGVANMTAGTTYIFRCGTRSGSAAYSINITKQ